MIEIAQELFETFFFKLILDRVKLVKNLEFVLNAINKIFHLYLISVFWVFRDLLKVAIQRVSAVVHLALCGPWEGRFWAIVAFKLKILKAKTFLWFFIVDTAWNICFVNQGRIDKANDCMRSNKHKR